MTKADPEDPRHVVTRIQLDAFERWRVELIDYWIPKEDEQDLGMTSLDVLLRMYTAAWRAESTWDKDGDQSLLNWVAEAVEWELGKLIRQARRRRRNRPWHQSIEDLTSEPSARTESGPAMVDATDEMTTKLTFQERHVLCEHLLAGKPVAEIAAENDMTARAVQRLLCRVTKRFQTPD